MTPSRSHPPRWRWTGIFKRWGRRRIRTAIPLAFRAASAQPQVNPTSPSGAPAPGPNITIGPNGTPTIQKGLSPWEESSANTRGQKLETFGEQLDKDAESAQQNNFLLDNMRRESQTWQLGKFADVKGNEPAASWRCAMNEQHPTLSPEEIGAEKMLAAYRSFPRDKITAAEITPRSPTRGRFA